MHQWVFIGSQGIMADGQDSQRSCGSLFSSFVLACNRYLGGRPSGSCYLFATTKLFRTPQLGPPAIRHAACYCR